MIKVSSKKNKVILFLLSVIVIVIIISFLSANNKQVIISYNKENLQILANEKASQVNMFLESKKEELLTISSISVFKEVIKYPNDTTKIELAENRINELKRIIPGISLMNNQGIVALGEIDLPGTDYSQHPYFIAKRQDISFTRYYDTIRKKDYYAVIGPIYDSTNDNKIIGRIAFDIELEEINNLMKGKTENETNEVYLIEENGLLLSNSKYIGQGDKKGVLIQEIKSIESEVCLNDLKKYARKTYVEEHEEEIPKYLNYMGNEVYGAHAYVPLIMGCVIAEKSVDEVSKSTLSGKIIEIIKPESKK